MNPLRTYLADFISLLFPQLCQGCGNPLVIGEHLICTDCRFNLPYTNFHLQPDNIVAQQFWGKLPVEAAYALCYFTKGGSMQTLIHHLKYSNQPEIGNILGDLAGIKLACAPLFQGIDLIVPVPLHKTRQRKRGYNQSDLFAEGIAARLHVPVELNNLIRMRATQTQTKKSRFERAANMHEVFAVANPENLAHKNILLVDDVMTTGSTLEACGAALRHIPGIKLYIAVMGYAA